MRRTTLAHLEAVGRGTFVLGAIVLMANLSALTDLVLHPEIPYFDQEHLIVGCVTALSTTVLFWIIAIETRGLRKERAALAERETFLANILDSIQDGISILDDEFRIVRTNAALEKGFGKSRPIAGEVCYEALYGRSDPCVSCPCVTSLRSGRPEHRTYRSEVNGKTTWFEQSAFPRFGADGRVLGVIQVVRDITDRRKTEEELDAQRELALLVMSTMGQGLTITDEEGRFRFVNAAYARMTGREPEELIGRRQSEVTAEEDRPVLVESLARRGRGESSAVETRLRRADGMLVPVLVTGVPRWHEGRVTGSIAVITDLTEVKRADEAVREAERFARSTVDALAASVAIVDETGTILRVNAAWRAFAEANGADAGKVSEGASYLSVCDRATGPGAAEAHAFGAGLRAVLGGEEERFTMEYTCHSPSEQRWFSETVTRFRREGPVRAVVVHENTTERNLAEETLLRSQKLEALGTLAGGIAHDFNNILLAISGNTKLAMADLPAESEAQRWLSEVQRASGRATALVRSILAFSRPQTGARRAMPLREPIEEASRLVRATLPAMIEVRTDLAAELPPVVCDPSAVQQAVLNLAGNAAHAIGERKGAIDLRLDEAIVDAETAAARPGLLEGRFVRLSVRDDGCGMDQATLRRAFDPFFTTKAPGVGTGLGLSVVHGIVRSHEGTVTVESEPGRGTTFELYFPVAATTEPQPASPLEPPSGRGERVLYVDDEEALVYLARRVLSRLGYEVTGCSSPLQALELFRSAPEAFDVVVTDLAMPVLSGLDLTRALREIRPGVPVVMTTGYLRSEDERAAANAGIRELILKPSTVDDLGHVLDRVLRGLARGGAAPATGGPAPSA